MTKEKADQEQSGNDSEQSIQQSLDKFIAQKREELQAMRRLLDSIQEETEKKSFTNSKK